jgi:hypothetical protein
MKKTMRERFHNNMFTDKMSYLTDITDCEIGKELLAKHLVCFKLVNEMDSNLSLFTKDKISKYLAFQLMDELSTKDFKFFIEEEIKCTKRVSGGVNFKKEIESLHYLKQKYIINFNGEGLEFDKWNEFDYKKFKKQFIIKYYFDVITGLPMNIFYFGRMILRTTMRSKWV